MENLVLLIEKEKFVRNLCSEIFKVKGGKIHTIDTIIDHYYLIADLNPSIIVFDVKTVGPELEKLLASSKAKWIAIGDAEDRSSVESRVNLFIQKPLVVSHLYEQINGVLN